jgi:hypothetical protein
MATLQQYSEVVAAYGYTAPPPEQPQVNRVGIALLYAAIGVALGTMTGTGVAAVSLQPGGVAGWAHRLSVPNLKYAHSAPQSQNLAVAHVNPSSQKAAIPSHVAPEASASVETKVALASPVPTPVKHTSLLARVIPSSVVEASVDMAAVHAMTSPVHHDVVHANLAVASSVPHQVILRHAASIMKPVAATVKLASIRAPAAAPAPSVMPVSLDEEVTPVAYYSEGDATVVDYDATLDTILTNDGRTFVVGATVAMSSASSWSDYRSNVHYRCDQGGKCTITRGGVVALNAKLI